MDMSFGNYRFRSSSAMACSGWIRMIRGMCIFMTPGIFRHNAPLYEFRVLEDSTVIKLRGTITAFMNPSFQLNALRKEHGYIGGFSTTWGHGIVVELRRKNDTGLIAVSVVHWQQTRPSLQAVFTTGETDGDDAKPNAMITGLMKT